MKTGRLALIVLAAALCGAQESAAPFVEWMTEAQRLAAQVKTVGDADATALARLREDAEALRNAISQWLLKNPQTRVVAPTADYVSRASRAASVDDLRALIQELIRLNPAGPFFLGRIEVQVTAEVPQVPSAYVIGGAEIAAYGHATVTGAVSMAPGVAISRVGARNEGVAYVRGFDMRQTPVFLDGMPVSVPYDGYLDLDRFLAQDIAEIHVVKGYSSPMWGPNALGGAINLVSRKPLERFHGEVGAGYESGRAFTGTAGAGARMRKLYWQASGAWLARDFFPLSGSFPASPLQPAHRRENSDRRDARGHFKLGLTPGAGDEYALGYVRQSARKGQPPYAGSDPSVKVRYWRWPEWGKDSLYHIANKSLGRSGYLRLRAYYDTFHNRLYSFDDATYSTQNRSGSFVSRYDDHSYGGKLEAGTSSLARQVVKTSLFLKDDTHKEHNLGEPQRSFRSRTLSAGLEDALRLSNATQAVVGFSADRLDVLQAQDFQKAVVSAFPIGGLWAFSPQVAVLHALSEVDRLRFTFARKTRLPTLKDRYSYRIGRSLPNPDLKEERADHLEAGYSRSFGAATLVEAAVFHAAISNLMQEFYVAPQLFQFRNVGRVEHSGFEFSARTDRLRPATIHAHYTFLNRTNVSLPGVPLIQTPRHQVFAAASGALRGVLLTGSARFETGRWDLSEGGRYLRLAGFAVVDGNATIPLGRHVELQAGARNLTDRNYLLDEGFPEEGRSFFLHLRYRF